MQSAILLTPEGAEKLDNNGLLSASFFLAERSHQRPLLQKAGMKRFGSITSEKQVESAATAPQTTIHLGAFYPLAVSIQ